MKRYILFLMTPIVVLVCAVFAQVATEQLWPPNIRACEHCKGQGSHWNEFKEEIFCKWCDGEGAMEESSVDPKTYFIFFFAFLIPCLLIGGYASGLHIKFGKWEISKENTLKIKKDDVEK